MVNLFSNILKRKLLTADGGRPGAGGGKPLAAAGRPGAGEGRPLAAGGRPAAGFVQLLLFCAGSFVLYFPILGRSFASDDFQVLKRVGLDRVIRISGFFRPLSDFKLYCNYLLGGFVPWGYYFSNILLHGTAAFFFYRFCTDWRWTEDDDRQGRYALLASLLFLCYPFHNECVAWVLGGGVLLANLFGIASLLAVVSHLREGWRIFLCCLFYFIGAAGYESVLLVPVMVLILLYGRGTGRRFHWGLALGMTVVAHFALRWMIAGGLANEYGSAFFNSGWRGHVQNLFKVAGRLLLPPMRDARALIVLFIVVMAVVGRVVYRRWRSAGERGYLLKLLLLLVVACGVALVSGVSTHTSESDRFLYFPSYFLCAGVAFLLAGIRGRYTAIVVAGVLLCYEIVFLEVNNRNWVKASGITREVVKAVEISMDGRRDPVSKVFIANLPDEWNGAYIFRLGLPDALLMEGRDTSGLVITGHLLSKDSVGMPDVRRLGADSFRISGSGDPQTQLGWEKGRWYTWKGGGRDVVLYWNGKGMVEWGLAGAGF